MPKIYYHYNHNWGSKRNNRRENQVGDKYDRSRKRFILELDWSGIPDKEHAGVSVDRSNLNQLKRNTKIDYKNNWGLKKNSYN